MKPKNDNAGHIVVANGTKGIRAVVEEANAHVFSISTGMDVVRFVDSMNADPVFRAIVACKR